MAKTGTNQRVLVTGGAGYIGSHAVLRLLRDGFDVLVVDNLVRGHRAAIDAVRESTGADEDRLRLIEMDVAETRRLAAILREEAIEAILHFAALAYVGESVDDPLRYHRNNAAGALAVLEAAAEAGVERFVFSSTCATYGEPTSDRIPIAEDCPQHPVNPYGRSKWMAERMIEDLAERERRAGRPFAAAMLRYFNVAGSDAAGVVGEDHRPETHLIPIALEAAAGEREHLTVFGTDYDTPDGTCVRDYVHVDDLIDAHVRVMTGLSPEANEVRAYNLGIGRGYSVREVIDACREVTGVRFPVREGARRAGDPPTLYADGSKARRELEWDPRYTDLREIVETAWRWKRARPSGYGD